MIIREHTLDKLESERLVEVLELQELWALTVAQKTQVLEDGECVACGGPQHLGRPIWESDRLELVGVEQTAIFLDNLVNYEHDELAQSRGRGR
jgi:hypothetical protein